VIRHALMLNQIFCVSEMPPDIGIIHALPSEQEWNGQHNHGQDNLEWEYN
jgi:hypothetical protein